MQKEQLKDRMTRFKESRTHSGNEELKRSGRTREAGPKKDHSEDKPEILTKYVYNPSENWIG